MSDDNFTGLPDILYADLEDEVTQLFERVKKCRRRQVAIVVPARAQLLQSLVGLKILRHKTAQAGKQVTLVTPDNVGRALAAEAGLATAEKLTVSGNHVELTDFATPEAPREKLTRRELDIAETPEIQPEKLERAEIPLAEPVGFFRRVWRVLAGEVAEVPVAAGEEPVLALHSPSRVALFSLLTAAVALFFFIVYIAVPTATVYITPRTDPLTKVVNVTLAATPTATAGSHTLPAQFLTQTFKYDLRIGATGEIFAGENARGKITLFNRSPRAKDLVPSRLQSADGLIFKTTRALTIPAAKNGRPGSVTTDVVACKTDDKKCDCVNAENTCEGKFVGMRGNIPASFFVFPALRGSSPSLYWGESSAPFTGGVTKITKFISRDDVANVKETAILEVEQRARTDFAKFLVQKNAREKTGLALLNAQGTVKVELLDLTVPTGLINQKQPDFAVTATAKVTGVAYEEDDLRTLISDDLTAKVHPEKTLTKIDFDGAAVRVEDFNPAAQTVRLAFTVTGLEEYDVSDAAAGQRLTTKIRERILGRPVAEAEKFIRNLPEVNSAEISSWPFWARTVPELPENVKFSVRR